MRVALSGPVTGRPREEAEAEFRDAARRLTLAGFGVFNPCEVVEADATHERAMRVCVRWIASYADGIVTLPGWESSAGACLEVAVARALGLPVMTMAEALA